MLYNASKPFDAKRATEKLNHLIEKGKIFEIKEKRQRRSIPQNSYLHLILSFFGLELGFTLEEVKQEIFKKIVCHDTFYEGEKGDKIKIESWRSTADLSTAETTTCIEKFRSYSNDNFGVYLPTPDDLASIQELEILVENNKHYLNP